MSFEHFKLGDVAEIVGGGTPSTKNPEFWDGDIPWITPKDLSGFEGVYISRGERSITQQGLERSSAKILPANSVLYTSRAPIGYVAISEREVATNQGFKSLVPKQGFSSEYLFYLLKASRDVVLSHSSGGTFAEISASAMREVSLPFPDIGQQQSIAAVLLGLDRKIRVNQSIAETLESIAQTLFRSWFVDFDPVRAKMAGEKPVGMDDATAALFPDSMEESELGEIPAGWTVGLLGDLCKLVMGQSPPGSAYNEEGIGLPFFQGRADFGERFPRRRVYSTEGKRKALAGEILVSVRAPVGDINQALEESVIGRGVASVLHRSGSEAYSFSLLKSLRSTLEYFNGEGTVFGAINKADFSSIQLVEPPRNVIAAFDEVCSPINKQIRVLHDQTESLVSVRDSLLPRLISGELQVPEGLVA